MCVLRACGDDFNPEDFLRTGRICSCHVFRKGDPRARRSHQPNEVSGFHADVSTASWRDLPAQVADAERYLSNNEPDLRRLIAFPGVTSVVLDFPVNRRDVPLVQSHVFPASLVRAAGALGIELELSLYEPPKPRPAPAAPSAAGGLTDVEALKSEIRAAFADVPYPGDAYLRGSSDGEEPYRVERDFVGKTDWSAIDPELLDGSPDGLATALCFFSDEALRFYLPAYLIADLDGHLRRTSPVFTLTHGFEDRKRHEPVNPRRYGARTWFAAAGHSMSVFDRTQAAAIVAYLEFRWTTNEFDRDDIEQALANFWRGRVGVARRAGDDDGPEGEA